jgi:hypothetical protein
MIALLAWATTGCIVEGNEDPATELRTVPDFQRVDVRDGIDMFVGIDPTQSDWVDVKVTAESNLLERIETDVLNDVLIVDVTLGVEAHLPMEVEAEVDVLTRAEASDGSDVIVDGLDWEWFEMDADDGGSVTATGVVDELHIRADDGGQCDAEILTADTVFVDIDEGGEAWVCATDVVMGRVNNGGELVVFCGGDFDPVLVTNGGSIRRG